jgi:hypothetical protein
MRHDTDGRVVEIGARTRTIPPALRRALHHRDRGCRFPGCGLPIGEGHHIRHCVHEEGFQVERLPDGGLERLDLGYAIDVLHPRSIGRAE